MSLLSRILLQRKPAEEEEYQPLDEKRLARLRWALDLELELLGQGANSNPHPRPVIMLRQPRDRASGWPSQSSWIGGLPRLGRKKWPRGEDGTPLPFVAQISMADLADICPESPLPEKGSLALFLGDGGAVHVEAAKPKETAHPGGVDAADQIPFWPLDMLLLEMPTELRIYHDGDMHGRIREAQYKLLSMQVPLRRGPFSIGRMRRSDETGFDTNYWHGPILLSAMFAQALDNLRAGIDEQEQWLVHARQELAAMQDAQYRDDTRIAQLENTILDLENDIPWQRTNSDTFAAFCDGFASLVAGKEAWAAMSKSEVEPVLNAIGEAHGRYDDLLMPGTPCNLEEMQDMCLRRMMTGADKAFALMPEEVLEAINTRMQLTPGIQHQIFGLGFGQPHGFAGQEDNLMLFQMGPDDLLETDMHGVDAWQFWISREDAAEGNWDKVKLVTRAR